MTATNDAFFAYPSEPSEIRGMVNNAISKFNARSDVALHPWERNDISGLPIYQPIFDRINDSVFLAADITKLNQNVVFEIGYAIGKGKRVLLFQNTALQNDSGLARIVGIFDTLGFDRYENSDQLTSCLLRHNDFSAISVSSDLNRAAPIYIVEPPRRGDPFTTLVSRVKKARWRYRSFIPSEEVRLSAMDAIRHVSQSAGVICPLFGAAHVGHIEHNLRALFVAGLAVGMEKPTLVLHSTEYEPPLDVRDLVQRYSHPDDIRDIIQDFSLVVTDYLQQTTVSIPTSTGILSSISIGDPTAENEMTRLGDYYLITDEFDRAVRGEVNLVVGRKGSGKTALFIQLRDRKRADRHNIVVDLKPEGYQLLKLKEDVLRFLTEGAQQHLITAFWEYLLILEIVYKILEKDRLLHLRDHRLTEIYRELSNVYGVSELSQEGDFSERINKLSSSLRDEYRIRRPSGESSSITREEVTGIVHRHDIQRLLHLLKKYLSLKNEAWLLFDNIDKGWSVGGVDKTDIFILRCLIDASRKLERDLRRGSIDFILSSL